MSYLNLISLLGIFGLCLVAWLFSEHRRVIPWRVIIGGILLQLLIGFLVFQFPLTRVLLDQFSKALDVVFAAADAGARFVFGQNFVPLPGQDPIAIRALPIDATACPPPQKEFIPGYCGTSAFSYIFAFRALPAVIFFSALMSLLYNIGVIQIITNIFAKVFYSTMRLSGAEALSGAANIFVGIEAAIAVKPFIAKMTRSELCAILSCCFGTAASSTLAIYVGFLRPVFPNILGHLVSASIIAIPACFVLSKILVPETEVPATAGGIPVETGGAEVAEEEEKAPTETVGGEPIERVSPLDAAIVGALDGVKMAVSIAAVLILIVGFVYLINQIIGKNTLQTIEGILFFPLTLLTGVEWNEAWEAAVIIGRRLTETAIPPYQALAAAAARPENPLSSRTVLIVSYALSGFAHVASVGIFVGGTIALAPSRRKDISALGWKALFVGTLATLMIACVAGFYDAGNPSVFGTPAPAVSPSPALSPSPTTAPAPTVVPSSPAASPTTSPAGSAPTVTPAVTPKPSP